MQEALVRFSLGFEHVTAAATLFPTPLHGSVPPNAAIVADSEQDGRPRQAVDATEPDVSVAHEGLTAKLAGHVPVGVPKLAKATLLI